MWEQVSFSCYHPGDIGIAWQINSETLRQSTDDMMISGDGHTLTIVALPQHNMTQVNCVAFTEQIQKHTCPAILLIQGTTQ